MNNYAIFNVNRNCWLYKFDIDNNRADYRNEPILFYREPVELAKFAKNVANATGDEFTIYELVSSGLTYKPSINSVMSAHTKMFAPKIAEFIHNTAIRFGDSREEKVNIAKELSESLQKVLLIESPSDY